jgi:hypothetical protein
MQHTGESAGIRYASALLWTASLDGLVSAEASTRFAFLLLQLMMDHVEAYMYNQQITIQKLAPTRLIMPRLCRDLHADLSCRPQGSASPKRVA